MHRRARGRIAVAAVLASTAIAASACGSKEAPRRAAAPAATATARAAAPACPAAGRHAVDGGVLRMPPDARAGRTPLLVVVIPGGGDDPSDRIGVGRAADRRGMAVLYPTKRRGVSWQLNREKGASDVVALTALLDRTAPDGGCFDLERISITGVSNGAGFAARLACELPRRFAAVIPVAAGYRALDRCPPEARASFLAIHGTADTVVPYRGAPPDRAGDVPRYTARWARRDGCSSRSRSRRLRSRVTRIRHAGCDNGLRVELVRLEGTSHGWPGAGPPLPRRNPSGYDATPAVVRFALSARRPAPR
jgi:polyhydroxybutyrate depolymerase